MHYLRMPHDPNIYHQAVGGPAFVEHAVEGHQGMTGAITRRPKQSGWIVDVQREAFKSSLADKHKAHHDAFLGPVIDRTFRQDGAGPACVRMTAQVFDGPRRNAARIPDLGKLDILAKIIWGENAPDLTADHARDVDSDLKDASLRLFPTGHWLQIDEPTLAAAEMPS